jgi:hypothetical protein
MPSKPPILAPVDRGRIVKIDKDVVADTAQSLKIFVTGGRWLGKTNRYNARLTAEKVAKEVASGGIRNQRQLAQYIVASAALHCNDGWGYLGRAISGVLSGDFRRALHLGYYAELRAALSILASVGIGVFNTKHFVISGPSKVTKLNYNRGTHEFVWSALKYWSSLPRSGKIFASVIRPGGRPLEEWMHSCGGARSLAPQARRWFLQWGMDIASLTEDKSARNEYSYRPDGIPESAPITCATSLDFVRGAWESLEPSGPSRFDEIDRGILRLALERAYKGRTGHDPNPQSAAYRKYLSDIVDDQGYGGMLKTGWMDYLARASSPKDLNLIELSSETAESIIGPLAVISRAALLLRVASGTSLSTLRVIEPGWKKYSFWYESLGQQRGLWTGMWSGDSFTDLWADVGISLEDLSSYQTGTEPAAQSVFGVLNEYPRLAGVMGSYERVALWSLLDG